jgi:hypothetical protein
MSVLRLPILVALLLSCAPMTAAAAPEPVTITDAERAAFHDQLIGSATMRGLMEADPAGFKAFEEGLVNDLAAGRIDANGARKRGYDFSIAARGKLLATLSSAPDGDYLAFVRMQLATMKMIGRYNLRACYELVENEGLSEDTIATLGPDLRTEIEKMGLAQMAAARAGAKTPVKRQPTSDKEGEALVQSYADLGGDMAWLKAMGDETTGSLPPDARCENATKWVEAVLAQPEAVAVRLLTTP